LAAKRLRTDSLTLLLDEWCFQGTRERLKKKSALWRADLGVMKGIYFDNSTKYL
jgi:hypothetical protein